MPRPPPTPAHDVENTLRPTPWLWRMDTCLAHTPTAFLTLGYGQARLALHQSLRMEKDSIGIGGDMMSWVVFAACAQAPFALGLRLPPDLAETLTQRRYLPAKWSKSYDQFILVHG